ncbi:MAG: FkbM family methyltransferase [Ignavibacteria bacterium]
MAFPCIRGHHIYASLLNSESVILDLGGHKGEFSSILNEKHGCTCHVLEAMPDLYEGIRQSEQLHAYHFAAGSQDGSMEFHISSNPESNSLRLKSEDHVGTIIVPTISIPSFMNRFEIKKIDLLKMDIEGAEIDVFRGMSDKLLQSIPQITVEFHDFIPEMQLEREVIECINRMKSLGFACIVFSRYTHFDVLFLNTRHCSIFIILLARLTKYFHGLGRIIRRFLG